jgi:hypothetical protein
MVGIGWTNTYVELCVFWIIFSDTGVYPRTMDVFTYLFLERVLDRTDED